MRSDQVKRVLIVQFAGDYREAFFRLKNGGEENFFCQKYSIEHAIKMAEVLDAYGVMSITGSEPHIENLENGVWSLNAGQSAHSIDTLSVVRKIDHFRPTHVVLTTPNKEVIDWCDYKAIHLLPVFADTFFLFRPVLSRPIELLRDLKRHYFYRRVARALDRRQIRWVGNHGVGACKSMQAHGIPAQKILPWDWPRDQSILFEDAKCIETCRSDWKLVFVGSLTELKGVGDAIDAVELLASEQLPVHLTVVGRCADDRFEKQVAKAGLEHRVTFTGLQPISFVNEAFRQANLALMPSWYEYAEGVPGTIFEAFATRTPVICTDHPGFKDRVSKGGAAILVPEKSPRKIADAIKRVMTDPKTYESMSIATRNAWKLLCCPLRREELMENWLANSADADAFLAKHSLASGIYD